MDSSSSLPHPSGDEAFLQQPEPGQRAFSCYFLVLKFAGLTSLSTRTTSEITSAAMAFRAGKQRNSMRKALSCMFTTNPHLCFQTATRSQALCGLRCSKQPSISGVCLFPDPYTQTLQQKETQK